MVINFVDILKEMCYFLCNMESFDGEGLQGFFSESAWLVGMHKELADSRSGADFLNFSREVRVCPL